MRSGHSYRGRWFQKVLASLLFASSLGLAGQAAAQSASPNLDMSFRAAEGAACGGDASCIVAEGVIGPETAQAFADFLVAHRPPKGAVVLLNSPGGELTQAMRMGAMIRRAGFDTRVESRDSLTGARMPAAECASACAYVFLAGRNRTVSADGAVGVHQFHAAEISNAISPERTQRLMADLINYLQLFGVDPRLLVIACTTPPEQMHWISAEEMIQLHMLTAAAAPTLASATPDVRQGG